MFYEAGTPHGLPYDPFKSCIVPRPIGWTTTLSAQGVVNLAPFSFFNGIAADPPMVMLSINGMQAHGGPKDTLRNIEETGEFVINMVPHALRDQMNATAAPVAADVDELELAGLTPAPSRLVAPPRVAESPVHLECTRHQVIDLPCTLPDSRNALVLGRVIGIHIADEVLVDGKIDLTRIRPLARLGYMDYTTVDTTFSIRRPAGG